MPIEDTYLRHLYKQPPHPTPPPQTFTDNFNFNPNIRRCPLKEKYSFGNSIDIQKTSCKPWIFCHHIISREVLSLYRLLSLQKSATFSRPFWLSLIKTFLDPQKVLSPKSEEENLYYLSRGRERKMKLNYPYRKVENVGELDLDVMKLDRLTRHQLWPTWKLPTRTLHKQTSLLPNSA